MNECTVVSIIPFELNENKPGLYPGSFHIDASKDGLPEVLVVKASKCYIPRLEGQKPIIVQQQPEEIAAAIVNDLVNAHIGTDEGARPGIFWVEGAYRKEEIAKKFPVKLLEAEQVQRNWFVNLVKLADDDWVKGNKRHVFISDIQRIAAKTLGLDREWTIKVPEKVIKLINCRACTSQINSEAVVCPQCHAILDETKYKTMQFVGV